MISWMCLMAGGPDHGSFSSQWMPRSRQEPYEAIASDGQRCRAIAVSFNGQFCHALFMHPDASTAELEDAERRFHEGLGVAVDELPVA
jgi:hypothetical protein